MSILITVLTPTYNRAYTLPRLYESLCRQGCKDFVWSVMDDGSTDDTEALVGRWIEENKIPILYHKQPNGGKMRAHNAGVRLCETPLVVCVDSDDFVPDNFVESVSGYWPRIESEKSLAGIMAYKAIKDSDGDFNVRCTFPHLGKSTIGNLYKSGFYGDTTLVFKTEVIKRFPFLEVEGEKFSSEAYAYDQIDREYEYLLADEIWNLCTYLPDGYTFDENALYARNPKGCALYYNQKVKFSDKGLSKEKIGYCISYMIYARRAGMKDIYAQSELKTPLYPFIWLLSYYYEWKWKEKYPK